MNETLPKLELVPVVRDLGPVQPAVMYTREAARYLKMSVHKLRELSRMGLIPHSYHINGRKPIFIKSDLDAYLAGLPRVKMAPRELQPNPRKARSV
jgi:hypothetical protein